MAPKSPSKSLSTADNSDNNIDKDRPSWDTSPITKPGYLVMLCRWLPAQDENHRLLVERGVTMQKERTVVVSDNHMDRHHHGLLPKGTFQKPTIVVPSDHSDVGLPEAEALAIARATYSSSKFSLRAPPPWRDLPVRTPVSQAPHRSAYCTRWGRAGKRPLTDTYTPPRPRATSPPTKHPFEPLRANRIWGAGWVDCFWSVCARPLTGGRAAPPPRGGLGRCLRPTPYGGPG